MKLYSKPMYHELFEKTNLTISVPNDCRQALKNVAETLYQLRDKDFEIKGTPARKRRSLDANAYMWVLADKIAEKIRSTKEEVYRKAVREVGVFHDGWYQDKDIAEINRVWSANGIGWFAEQFDSTLPGCKRIRFYHGSSLYDTKQMSRLIDYIVEEAKEQGIETATPEDLERMKVAWGGAS